MRFPHTRRIAPVIAILITFSAQPIEADDAARQYEFAKGLYARAQWNEASEEFDRFLREFPDHVEALEAEFYLGEALVQQRRFREAIPRFEAYTKAQPDGKFHKLALFRVAECEFFEDQQDAEQRLAAFSEAFPDDQLNGISLAYRGTIALRQGDARTAETLFRQSLDRFQDAISQDECRIGLARALESLGNAEEAERYYLAVAAKPQSSRAIEAKYRLGSLQYARHEFASALKSFTELDSIPESDPWAAGARLGEGWALVKLGRHHDAATVFASLIDHESAAVQARYWLGLCRKAEQSWDDATKAFLAALEKLREERARPGTATSAGDVTETAILFHAGDSQLAAGNLDGARSFFERSIEEGNAGDYWLDEARRAAVQTSLRLKDLPRARSDAERFLAARPGSRVTPDLLRLLARIQLEQNDFVDAERTLCCLDEEKLAFPDAAGDLQDEYLLALAYQGQRRFETALRVIKPVLAGATASLAADARLVEASLLVAMQRFDEALRVLAAPPSDPKGKTNDDQVLALSAVCHAKLGHLDEAQRLYTKAYGGSDDSTTIRWDAAEQIAEAALQAKQYDEAETLYREMIEGGVDDDRRSRALVGLAWVQHGRSDDTSAEATLAKLIEDPRNAGVSAEARFLRGRVLCELGELEAACASFEQLARDHAETTYGRDALWEAAQLQEQLGRSDQAAAEYLRIIDLEPPHAKRADALYNLAWIRRQEGKDEEAASLFRRISAEYRDSPYWPHALLSVAQHDFDTGHPAEAAAALEDLLAGDRSSAVRDRALYLAGQIALAEGRWQESRRFFERIIADCPDSDLVRIAVFGAAEAAFQSKDSEALTLFEQLADTSGGLPEPYRATARMRLAQLYAEAERWDDAARIAESFATDHPDFSQQYELDYVLGRCLAARALFAEARQAYEKVIRSPAGDRTETAAKAQLMIGETYFHQRRYAEAYRAYMQVEILYDYPELQAAALLQSGKCRELQGDSPSATEHYQQVLKNHPGTKAAEQAARKLGREN